MVLAGPIIEARSRSKSFTDESLFCGEMTDPHGEERRVRRVSNHEARSNSGHMQ